MKKFKVFVKNREVSVMVEADKVGFVGEILTFSAASEVKAQFMAGELQGWKEETQTDARAGVVR